MSQSPFGLAPVKRVGCSRSPGPASTQQKTNPGKLGPHAAPNSMLSRTSARFPLFSSQVKTTTTQRFGLGSYHLAFTRLVCAVDKPILHHDGSPALAFQRLVRANFVWRDIPVLSALALVRSAIGHTGILLPLYCSSGCNSDPVWSIYPHGRAEFMMDVPHDRQQMGSPVGLCHRPRQSEAPAPERIPCSPCLAPRFVARRFAIVKRLRC